jgi:SulP family sulfate permease
LNGVIAVTLIKLVESISISKSIAFQSGQKLNTSREFLGQGMASLVGGFFQCYPPSGSLSRSAIVYRVGGKTRLASTFSGLFVWIVLGLASGLLGYIPTPSLAAIVVVSAIGLINTHHIVLTWKSRIVSRIVMIVTFLATVFSSPENAIYLGALLSIIIYLVESRHLEIKFLKVTPEGKFVERSYTEINQERPSIILADVEGDFFFGAADELEETITPVLESGIKVLIIRVRRLRLMSSTGINSINGIIHTAQRRGVKVIICGVKTSISKLLDNSGISLSLGKANIFYATEVLHESTTNALKRANELVDQTPLMEAQEAIYEKTA